MLCVPEVFFWLSGCWGRCMLHVCEVYKLHIFLQRTGRGVTNLGRCIVLLCRLLAPAMYSSEPEELHSVMHLGVQREAI